jgi:hypothetical protein
MSGAVIMTEVTRGLTCAKFKHKLAIWGESAYVTCIDTFWSEGLTSRPFLSARVLALSSRTSVALSRNSAGEFVHLQL